MIFRILIFFTCCVLTLPAHANIRSCGDLDDDFAEDAYDAADRVDFYFDVKNDIVRACNAAKAVRAFEKRNDLGRDRDFQRLKRDVIKQTERALQGIEGPLIALNGFLRADADTSFERARLRALARNTLRNVRGARFVLNEKTILLRKLSAY